MRIHLQIDFDTAEDGPPKASKIDKKLVSRKDPDGEARRRAEIAETRAALAEARARAPASAEFLPAVPGLVERFDIETFSDSSAK